MEIYRQRINNIYFELPEGVTEVTATASLNDGPPITIEASEELSDGLVKGFVLPYVADEGLIKVTYSFPVQTFDENTSNAIVDEFYDVVTPILSDYEIKKIHPNATYDEIRRIEKAVRHVINAHCGQGFGRFVGKRTIQGSGTSEIQLPMRLLSLDKVNNTSPSNMYEVGNGGWTLRFFPWGVPPVKADAYGYHIHTGGVIHNPNAVGLGKFSKRDYVVDGTWGWEEVPSQVREAAKLLINDYACADASYRDRYLTSMTAADWRIQFYSGAFQQTGNVRADQLLSDFVLRRGWVAI